jgi:hypothetical protein
MPRSTEVSVTCACGAQFSSTIHHAVNVTLEPQLLYELLGGTLNVATCPNCGRKIASGLPFIYHDLKRGLFAYVHPNSELPAEERERMLDDLRRVYSQAVEESERISPTIQPPAPPRRATASRPREAADVPRAVREPEAPPMQVIFGMDRLVALVESLLEPEERLGRIALTTQSQDAGERDRLLGVARRMASGLGCQVESEDADGTFTVWLYGPRGRVSQLVKLLHAAS